MPRRHRPRTLAATGAALTVVTLVAPGAAASPVTARKPSPAQALAAAAAASDRAGGVGVVAAATKDRSHWEAASGYRSTTPMVRALPTDRARAGSITKTMTATIAMQLVDEGRLSLSTRIDQVVPGLVPGHGHITLEQLLSHRSGLPDYALPLQKQEAAMKLTPAQSFARTHTDAELIRLALTQPVRKPGAAFSYANTNYLVVGQMVQRRTGRPMARLMQERVFRRAGMRSSYYADRTWTPATFLTEHYVLAAGPVPLRANATVFGAAGAVVSTPADLDAFMRALMQGRMMSGRGLSQMLRPRSATPAYGLGIFALPDPCAPKGSTQKVYGHDGLTYGTHAMTASTRDGRRVASAMVTGRHFTADAAATMALASQIVGKAHASMC